MLFGNDDYFRKWSGSYYKDSPGTFTEVAEVVRGDMLPWVRAHAQRDADDEDIMSEIIFKLFTNFGKYIENSQDRSPAERNSYLKLMAKSVCTDFYRREKRSLRSRDTSGDGATRAVQLVESAEKLDAIRRKPELEHGSEAETLLINREALRDVAVRVLKLDCKPEKELCALLNFFMYNGYGGPAKGYMCWLNGQLCGKTLYELLDMVKRQLCPFDVGDEYYAPLERELAAERDGKRYGDNIFDADVRDMVVWASSVRSKLRDGR